MARRRKAGRDDGSYTTQTLASGNGGLLLSVFENLRRNFPADLAKVAVVVPNGADVTYGELDRRSSQMAAVLDDLNLDRGAVVAVQADKCVDFLGIYLGMLRSGRTFLPLNPTYTAEEVGYYLRDSHAELLVCQPERAQIMQQVATESGTGSVLTLDSNGTTGSLQIKAAASVPIDGTAHSPLESDPAVLLYTSGTTGKPKGALLSHSNVNAMIDSLHEAWGWTEADVLLHALPLFHIHGLFVAATVALRAGATMVLQPRFDPDLVFESLPRSTLFMGVPTMYHRLIQDARLTPHLCAGVRLFVSGSAPLSIPDFERFRDLTGHVILERYGMTETGMITSNPLLGDRKPGAVGLPLPGVEVRLAEPETMAEDPGDGVGEIWVRGANVFRGYLGRPEANVEAFVDGWFKTGDLGFRDSDGYYSIVGRARDLVISGGLNVYPAEVENVLNAVPGVEECAVIGLPDEDLGERVTAVIVRSGSEPDLSAETVMAEARKHLAPYKCPRLVEFVDALPRNAMGKIDKESLRRRFAR